MKHRDKWDDYFDQHGNAFEEDVPDVDRLWEGISAGIAEKQPPKAAPARNPLRYWVAATMLLGALCIGLLAERFGGFGDDQSTALLGVEDAEVDDFAGTTVQFVLPRAPRAVL